MIFFHEGYGIVFDELKKQIENRPHLELPETCVIPTYKEISEKKAFDEYCGASNCPRPWHKDGEKVLNRYQEAVGLDYQQNSLYKENIHRYKLP